MGEGGRVVRRVLREPDNIVPDFTILRFRKSGFWSRVFTIQVLRAARAAWWRGAHFLC
jgi:hypothetical protein